MYPKLLMDEFSERVGRNQSVFDVAAGYGRIAKFIDPSNIYYGIDRNEIFVNHGRQKGRKLEIKDIFDPGAYKESDVFLAIDIVHHLSREKLKDLFDIVFQHARKKVIIMEPAFVHLVSKYGVLGKFIDWFFRKIDYDGFNIINHWFTNEEYSELFKRRLGSQYGNKFSLDHRKVSNRHLVTFTRNHT